MSDNASRAWGGWRTMLGIGAATAAAHIGNNFTTYLIGGLIDRYGFTPVAMGAWNMVETLSYAAAMFFIAPRVGRVQPRTLVQVASVLVILSQIVGGLTSAYAALLLTRIGTGVGFGLANTALNLAAGATKFPARAISIGITVQTILYAGINIGLPLIGREAGVGGMFLALAAISAVLLLGTAWLPNGRSLTFAEGAPALPTRLGPDGARVLVAMALFTYGTLSIWPFMERAGHAIGISAVEFGRYQSVATLASALGNLVLAAIVGRVRQNVALGVALVACGAACATLTTTGAPAVFGLALIAYNVAWFVTYPLLLGIAYRVDEGGRLSVLCSAVWLAMTALGSVTTGLIAQMAGGYGPVGPLGLLFCLGAAICATPLTNRSRAEINGVPLKTG